MNPFQQMRSALLAQRGEPVTFSRNALRRTVTGVVSCDRGSDRPAGQPVTHAAYKVRIDPADFNETLMGPNAEVSTSLGSFHVRLVDPPGNGLRTLWLRKGRE